MNKTEKINKENESLFPIPDPKVCIKTFSERSTNIVVDGVCLGNAKEFTYHVKGGEKPVLTVTLEISNDGVFQETPGYMK